MRSAMIGVGVLALAAASGSALAQTTLLTFNFQNLSARYLAASGNFNVSAQNAPSTLASFGGVAANLLGNATTNFGTPATGGNPATGFLGAGSSNFGLDLTASGFSGAINAGGLKANGFGTFTITDPDGDRLTGSIVGATVDGLGWNQVFSTLIYQGFLQNVQFVQRPGGTDTLWTGPNGGSFDWTQVGAGVFNGSIVTLNFVPGGFGASFNQIGDWGFNGTDPNSAVPLGANAQLIPAPAVGGLLGLAGLAALRRRRR